MKTPNWKTTLATWGMLGTLMVVGQEIPKNWHAAGSNPKDYSMFTDRDVKHTGKASASVMSVRPTASGFGTLMQTFNAETFRGKRVRMSGYVKSEDVIDWAGLWMRVDGPAKEMLAFDNMQSRSIKKTTDWAKYEIVLDVPETSQDIAFGILLSGGGQVWMDDLKFEVVDKKVPTTASAKQTQSPKAPANLGFEE